MFIIINKNICYVNNNKRYIKQPIPELLKIYELFSSISLFIFFLSCIGDEFTSRIQSEEENPLTLINKIHSHMKKFRRNHEGFSRDNIQDWMNLISFIINDPENRYDKLKLFLKNGYFGT